MRRTWLSVTGALAGCALFAGALAPVAQAGSRWGADYFPNTLLTTSTGETVRFFDDLIRDKIVAINFIYTSCPDTCPLETAQLVQVQNILGERLGREVFFYSISIDPDTDTPDVLERYRQRFGARWTFLTGNEQDIIVLRRKLGLYIEEIQDGSNNHNVSMIIGNQSTGRWMRRSPFENPYVLADQIGNWLADWKPPPRREKYADAPALRDVSPGEHLFRTRCASCHTLDGNERPGAIGPDLLGVTRKRELNWLLNWLRAPDEMLAAKDPIALSLYRRYREVAMPNMRLNQGEAMDLVAFMDTETQRRAGAVVNVSHAWVREAHAGATTHAGYLVLDNSGPAPVTLIGVASASFESVEVHEMAVEDGLMSMRELHKLVVPPQGQVVLEPGGRHLMMHGAKRPLVAGDRVELELSFESGARQQVALKVQKTGEPLLTGR